MPPPPPSSHFAFLDRFRGIAIAAVFSFHCVGASFESDHLAWGAWFRSFDVSRPFLLTLPLTLGWCGVSIFFAISGFCIHLSFARKPDWAQFWVRRFFRVYPPYFFAVLVFCLWVSWRQPLYWRTSGALDLGSHLLLVHNWWSQTFFGQINKSYWSIAVEAQLYLLYPAMLLLASRAGWHRALAGIAAMELALRAWSGWTLVSTGSEPPLFFLGLPFLYCFSWFIGVAVADAHLTGRAHSLSGSPAAWGAAAVGCYFCKPLESFAFLCFSLATAAAMARLLESRNASERSGWLHNHLCYAGVRSYSMYLLHQPILFMARRVALTLFGESAPQLVVLGVCLCSWLPILMLSSMWHRLVELPSISLGRSLSARG